MITSLQLRNFRKHRELDLEFKPGLNQICGPNWAGKTTILSALAYGLFGTKAARGTADQLVTQGEKAMAVTVEFVADGKGYRVDRTLKTATLYRKGEEQPIATGHSPVTEEIEFLIGLAMKDFQAFHVTLQKEAASLLTLGSAKLNEYVAKVTGVDIVDSVLERTKEELTKATAAAQWAQSGVSKEQVEQLAETVASLSEARIRLQAEVGLTKQYCNESLAPALQEAQDALLKAEEGYLQAEAARRAVAVAEGVLKAANTQLDSLMAKAKQPGMSLGELWTRQKELTLAKQRLQAKQQAEAQMPELEARKATAEQSIQGWEADLAAHPEVNTTDSLQLRLDLNRELEAAQEKASSAAVALTSSECPYCMRPFEDADQESLRQALAKETAACEALEERYEAACAVHEDLLVAQRLRGTAEEALKGWQSELKAVWELIGLVTTGLSYQDTPESVFAEQEVLLQAQEENRAFEEWQAQKTKWKQEAASAREKHDQALELAKKGVTHTALAKARAAEADLTEQMTKASLKLTKLEGDLRNTVSLHAQQKADLLKMEEDFQRMANIVGRRDTLAELGKFLRQNRDRFTVSVWEQLLGHASQFIAEATSGAVTALTRGADGAFSYEEGGELREVEGNASGMQETIFSTAVKLSLAAALGSRFGTFLFDEVTAAASDDTSLTFLGRLARAGSQVILVTHRQGDAAVADHLIQL